MKEISVIPLPSQVCDDEGNWGGKSVGHMSAQATGLVCMGCSLCHCASVCAQQPRDVWTLDRVAPLRFKVRISKHDHCQSPCSCNELGMWCVPTKHLAVPKLLKKKNHQDN